MPVNTDLEFSAANNNPIIVDDIDAGNNDILVEVSVSAGTLGFSSGSVPHSIAVVNGEYRVQITSTVTEINGYLEELYFRPAIDFAGIVDVSIRVDDQGNTGSGPPLTASDIFAIEVTGTAPTPDTIENTYSGIEDEDSIEIDLGFSDNVSDVIGFRVRSLPTGGTLFSDAAFTVTVSAGDLVDRNNVGPELYYRANDNFNGQTTFEVASVDRDGREDPTPATQTISIAAVNDRPFIDLDLDNSSGSPGIGFLTRYPAFGDPVFIADGLDATLSDIDNGLVSFQHDGSSVEEDSFEFTVTDGYRSVNSGLFTFKIDPSNVTPVIATQPPALISENTDTTAEPLLAILAYSQDHQLQEVSNVKFLDDLIATQAARGLAVEFDMRYLRSNESSSADFSNLIDFEFTFGAVTAVGTLGYILWSLRSGMLVALALTQLPTWKMIDPLPVLETYETANKKADNSSAGRLFS